MILLIILIYLQNLFAQNDSLITYFPNGNIESIIYLKNSLREGKAVFFFENGNIKEERNYMNDKVSGIVKLY
ncbi:MAG: hypothetical protein N2043_12980, partial [Ignavibacterium sp.]|nr:hypothetical protein [Ignavibacterium sp.]